MRFSGSSIYAYLDEVSFKICSLFRVNETICCRRSAWLVDSACERRGQENIIERVIQAVPGHSTTLDTSWSMWKKGDDLNRITEYRSRVSAMRGSETGDGRLLGRAADNDVLALGDGMEEGFRRVEKES